MTPYWDVFIHHSISDSNNRREFGGAGVSAGNKSHDITFEPRITRSTTAGNQRRSTRSASRGTIL